ncbi:MAG: hypothetical protein ACRDH7_08610 [Actinomycetota bacterium]
MGEVRVASVTDPFAEDDPSLVVAAMEALLRLEAMGLLTSDVGKLDRSTLLGIAEAAARAGIAQTEAARLMGARHLDPETVREFLDRVTESLLESPMPGTELVSLLELFDHDELARLLGSSESSLRRYASGARRTPDDLAARAHFLSLVVGYLRGAYNDIGVRRWFARPRTTLGGKTPAQVLRRGWSPDSAAVGRVLELARALTASPVT